MMVQNSSNHHRRLALDFDFVFDFASCRRSGIHHSNAYVLQSLLILLFDCFNRNCISREPKWRTVQIRLRRA
ncbi:hypothetical protein QVD17_06257 [Tagetes erecta]|uniref:Uncharacterized protein n=1 Tax=Tagetes erecta TaxID=13708 RepID=A0AAD8P676_TARER|nr:hypothetical protein QVD17_06257 [Tagetes erecta]